MGIFLASRVTYMLAFVRLRCGVPGRYEYICLFAGLGGGPVRVFCFWLSFGVCLCDLTGGGGGGGAVRFF